MATGFISLSLSFFICKMGIRPQNVQDGFAGIHEKLQAHSTSSISWEIPPGRGDSVAWDRVTVTLFWTGATLGKTILFSGLSLPICNMDRN